MPQRRNAIKALRQNQKRRLHNLDFKTELRKTTKKFLSSVETKNLAEARSNLNLLFKKLDKAIKRNILHKNTASHRKSRFSKLIKNIV